ncbi:MAG: energy transducer TonB [Nitrospinae bacterium]|nr:energy transducer TonB [Nitrospinota bacterium]
MADLKRTLAPDKAAGLITVLALHGIILAGLWSYQIAAPKEALTVFVNFINPPAPEKPAAPPQAPKPRLPLEQKAEPLAARAPVTLSDEPVTEPPPPEPVIESAPEPVAPMEPVALASQLAVVCPERAAPRYPLQSRRLGQQGRVTLRVELDETGAVAAAAVSSSSGYPKLDEAALAAVTAWKCAPVTRDGAPARAVALQPFDFILEGR